jgi:hypothetical protein
MQAMATPTTASPADSPAAMIDLERYPILDLDSIAAKELIRTARDSQGRMGACELPVRLRRCRRANDRQA